MKTSDRDDPHIRQAMARALGGYRALDEYTAQRFNPSRITKAAYDAAVGFDHRQDNLYLHGPVGTGKSHLAAIVARQFVSPTRTERIVYKPQEISRLVRAAPNPAEAESDIIRKLGNQRVLVLEELGREKDTEFMSLLLSDIFDWRYQNKPGGLVIASNLSPRDLVLKFGDEFIPSRLAQTFRFFDLTGEPDHRLERCQRPAA